MRTKLNRKLIITISFSVWTCSAQICNAQSDPFLMISTAVQLAAQGINSQNLPEVPKDQIRGSCEFNTTHCPGAKVVLKNLAGEEIGQQTISSKDEFVFTALKPGEYFIEISYPRYKLKPASHRVSTGSKVRIEMQESTSK